MSAPRTLLTRLLQASLWLYPAAFRKEWGDEVLRHTAQLEQKARNRRFGRLRLAWRLLADAATAIPRAHRWDAAELRIQRSRPYPKETFGMSTWSHDLRVAVRRIRQNPGFTLAAALTLALGIGANTAIFSVVYGVLLRPLGVTEPDSLAVVRLHVEGNPADVMGWGPGDLEVLQQAVEGQGGVERLGSYVLDTVTLRGEDRPEELGSTLLVDGDFFPVLGVAPIRGRALDDSDVPLAQRGTTCVISESLWRGRFGADPDLVGSTLTLDDMPVTVVGVMPDIPLPLAGVQVWMPQGWDSADRRWTGRISVLARLSSPDYLAAASVMVADETVRLRQSNSRLGNYTASMVTATESIVGRSRGAILAAAGAVGLILLIACANLANLLLSRALVRAREIATRRALGARRIQLAAQLLIESTLLASLGGVLGVAMAFALHRALLGLATGLLPRLYDVRLDLPVLAFAAGLALIAGILFGMAPVLFAWQRDLVSMIRGRVGLHRGGRADIRPILVAGQVAVAVILVTAAVLLVRNLMALRTVEPGFLTAGVGGARVYLDDVAYATDVQEAAFFVELLERVRAMPGVQAAGATSGLPLDPHTIDYDLPYNLPGEERSDQERQAYFRTITPGYLETLGVPLLRGRLFSAADRADGELVALINATFARTAWGDRDPVGEHFAIYGGRRQMRVVGVVGDMRFHGPGEITRPSFYVPHSQITYGAMAVIARSTDGVTAADLVSRAALEVDPRQPVNSRITLDSLSRGAVAVERFYTRLLTAFGVVALLLAAGGIYSVIAYWVTESRRELGLRLAVGAVGTDIVSLVMRRSLLPVACGLALGFGITLALAGRLEAALSGVRVAEGSTLAAVVLVLAAAAVIASLIPAWRAAHIDPVRSLRME